MATYSHSRVSCFENCPYQYKLKYIDREEPDIDNTIEAFMGSIVHEALEELYKWKKFKKRVSKASLIKFYKDLWDKQYSDDIKIVKKGLNAKNYKKMGEEFLVNYYNKYKPFEQLTILGLETQDRMTLKDGNQWHVRIDRFACDDKGNYYVCDYKTNASMKNQEDADSDRQLAMYSLWVKDKFKDAKSVKLVWHMLAFNKEVVSERSDKELEVLEQEIIDLISKIKKAEEKGDFPTSVSNLCEYCGYKSKCPSFKHLDEIQDKPIKKFKDDEGVRFVDDLAEIKNRLKELTKKEVELSASLIDFAKQKGVDVVYGSNMKASVKEFDKIVMPEDKDKKDKFIQLMKDKGIYDDCSMVCYPRLNSWVISGHDAIDDELKGLVEVDKGVRVGLSKRANKEED